MMDTTENAIVIGAGPAGLSATYYLSQNNIPTKCFEADSVVGGISRTVVYDNFRFDIGGHRFFTKIPSVNELWHEILGDEFLKRPRISRIFYDGKFYHYPLRPFNALFGLGPIQTIRILSSYLKAKIMPFPQEDNFEQWVSNRFGAKLYNIFFKTYTEKVWGIPCSEIQAEWAAQRIKGLSLYSAVMNAFFKSKSRKTIKTLINEFEYPRLGPGQMYETMANRVQQQGAEILMESKVHELHYENDQIKGILWRQNGMGHFESARHIISTMPINELIFSLRPVPPEEVIRAAKSLAYRSLLTVNLLIRCPEPLPDTWIYIHDPSVQVGRIQCFANWSPSMVPNKNYSSRGLEYFCTEGDELWCKADEELIEQGKQELAQLGLVDVNSIMDGFVVRMPKCYPVYHSGYTKHLEIIKNYLSRFRNLQLCGRYGLFKYNNMDHSIWTAQLVVENVLGANHDVWAVNTNDDYHEELPDKTKDTSC